MVTADDVQTGPEERHPLGRILVATDRSATADLAVRWAAQLANRYSAELMVLQVVAPATDAASEKALDGAKTARAEVGLQLFATEVAGSRGRAKVVIDADPAQAHSAGDRRRKSRRGRGGKRGDGRAEAVSAREHSQSRVPQRPLHCHHRQHRAPVGPGSAGRRDPAGPADAARTATPGPGDPDPAGARQDDRARVPESIRVPTRTP